jgi:lipopolysaccharide transport system ATP-binding protein
VAFAEIEKFIDTPVKHYSSGMYVRLAFAVAAHLEPEILLVDEVLAVGDINFQKKCLGKMGEVAKGGRTVVLVSHQLNQIRRLCERVVWVDNGTVRQAGTKHEVVSAYEAAMARGERDGTNSDRHEQPPSAARFLAWDLVRVDGTDPHKLSDLEPVTLRVSLEVLRPIPKVRHGIALYDHEQRLVWAWTSQRLNLEVGSHELHHTFPMLPVRPGRYTWHVSLFEQEDDVLDNWYCIPEMIVSTSDYQSPYDQWTGFLNLATRFEITTKLVAEQGVQSEGHSG